MTRPTSPIPHGDHGRKAPPGKGRRPAGRLSRLILWEWGIVLALLSGLGITVLAISHPPDDPKGAAEALVAQMRASTTRPSVLAEKVPPKVCVLASWELYRTGTVTVNGVTPQRISAAVLVDLCNQGGIATILWTPQGRQ